MNCLVRTLKGHECRAPLALLRRLWLSFALCLFAPAVFSAPVSDLDKDEQLIFFPTIGYRTADGKAWEIELHGCIYEPERRRITLALMREALELKDIDLTSAQNAILTERARLFLLDHERGKQIVIRLAGKDFKLKKSEPNGRFTDKIRIAPENVGQNRSLAFHARLPSADTRLFAGRVKLVDSTGITVISDIDDTIKVTNVTDRKATLRSTFLEPFQPVRGMPELYSAWAEKGAQFWYVSASPWQLFLPLNEFVHSNRFPAGAFYLKDFRFKDKTVLSLFSDPEKYKPNLIEPLLKKFPQRSFVLVGDSGERDPEIYGALARRFPRQVVHIFIRDVAPQSEKERYKIAFRELSRERWTVFREPGELLSGVSGLFREAPQ